MCSACYLASWLLPPPRRLCFRRCLSVCLLLATLHKNFWTDLHEIFREGWQWGNEQTIKFRWWSGSSSGYGDCFLDSSLLGHTESRIKRLCCAMLQCWACTSRHRHSNYDVITSPAFGRCMHCPNGDILWCSVCLSLTFVTFFVKKYFFGAYQL